MEEIQCLLETLLGNQLISFRTTAVAEREQPFFFLNLERIGYNGPVFLEILGDC